MEDVEPSDLVALAKHPVGRYPGRARPEVERERTALLDKGRDVIRVDGYLRIAHMGDLADVGRVVVVAMGEDDHLDLVPVRLDRRGRHARVHEHGAGQVGVREHPASRNPSDRHTNHITTAHHILFMHGLIEKCLRSVPEVAHAIARDEGLVAHRVARAIARGRIVVPANPRREHRLCAVGEGCRVKVNVNVGTSGTRCDPAEELEKARAALAEGADALMDLSTGGDLPAIRQSILALDAPVGTVPIYEAVRRAGNAADVDADLLFRVIREHCRDGVDFLTLHCGVNRDAYAALVDDPRVMGVVSRGGAFHTVMMAERGEENPLYAEFDYLCELLAEHGVVASLGDGMRPGARADAERLAKATEYLTLGRLAKRALAAGVERMIEGPGHLALDQVGYNVRMLKELTDDAPLYLLGPLVTDLAPGYDHVVGAIGGAVACQHGADFLCMVSPAEHLALPDRQDIIEGTRVARLAAHVGTLSRRPDGGAARREDAMGQARRRLDWDEQFRLALFPEHARRIHERDGELETCSMCGDLCAIRLAGDLLPPREADRDADEDA